jgi:hypothetical protein
MWIWAKSGFVHSQESGVVALPTQFCCLFLTAESSKTALANFFRSALQLYLQRSDCRQELPKKALGARKTVARLPQIRCPDGRFLRAIDSFWEAVQSN